MFNIDEFYAQLSKRGTIKSNKFKVAYSLPDCFQGDPNAAFYTGLIRDMELRIDKAIIPGVTFQMASLKRYGYGPVDKVPLFPTFDDVQISVVADQNGDFWEFYNRWMNKTINSDLSTGAIWDATEMTKGRPLSPYEVNYKNDYTRDITISWYSDDGFEAKQIVLNDAYPNAVSEVKLDWGDGGDVARFMVNLTYQDRFIQQNPDQWL